MTVYVDQPLYRFGRMQMCHMVADSISELHQMADILGIRRKWFQNKRLPHYDICKSKRSLAISNGAVEVDSKTIVYVARKCASL